MVIGLQLILHNLFLRPWVGHDLLLSHNRVQQQVRKAQGLLVALTSGRRAYTGSVGSSGFGPANLLVD